MAHTEQQVTVTKSEKEKMKTQGAAPTPGETVSPRRDVHIQLKIYREAVRAQKAESCSPARYCFGIAREKVEWVGQRGKDWVISFKKNEVW